MEGSSACGRGQRMVRATRRRTGQPDADEARQRRRLLLPVLRSSAYAQPVLGDAERRSSRGHRRLRRIFRGPRQFSDVQRAAAAEGFGVRTPYSESGWKGGNRGRLGSHKLWGRTCSAYLAAVATPARPCRRGPDDCGFASKRRAAAEGCAERAAFPPLGSCLVRIGVVAMLIANTPWP